jgi:hypothetical protein
LRVQLSTESGRGLPQSKTQARNKIGIGKNRVFWGVNCGSFEGFILSFELKKALGDNGF